MVVPGLDVLSESASAEIVREMYRQWLTSADPFAFIAEDAGRPVGFVVGFYDEPHFMWATGRVGHIRQSISTSCQRCAVGVSDDC